VTWSGEKQIAKGKKTFTLGKNPASVVEIQFLNCMLKIYYQNPKTQINLWDAQKTLRFKSTCSAKAC